jgi:hypothetical protein
VADLVRATPSNASAGAAERSKISLGGDAATTLVPPLSDGGRNGANAATPTIASAAPKPKARRRGQPTPRRGGLTSSVQ